MNTMSIAAFVGGNLAFSWISAFIMDRVRPETEPPESLYPKVGDVLRSRAEGVAMRIIKADSERTWIEGTLAPHAPGPPPHVHRTFAENFFVAKGTLSLRVGNDVKVLHAGDRYTVQPGVVHQPFNDTAEEVVLRGPLTPEYALPRDFVLFLSQVYGFVDDSPSHVKLPAILLQMSIFGPKFDTWLATPSLFVQRVQYALLRPIARMLGYRSYYARYAPQVGAESRA